jgi:hypothetical protein
MLIYFIIKIIRDEHFRSRNLPSCVFVLSLLYMKRLRALQSSSSSLIKIDNLTTKELYLIAALLADKYLIDEGEDEQLFNSELAQLTGITTERINLIERQVLLALNWNLHVPNDEFEQFFSLFKDQMARKLNKTIESIETDDPINFYNLCFQFLPQIFEYLALTSIILLGSTLSILTAIHMSTLTHSAIMKTLNPTLNCSQSSNCYWSMLNLRYKKNYHFFLSYLDDHDSTNTSFFKQNSFLNFEKYSWNSPTDFTNETTDKLQCSPALLGLSSCSIDLLRPYSLTRPIVQTIG